MPTNDSQQLQKLQQLLSELYYSTSCSPTATRIRSFAKEHDILLTEPAAPAVATTPHKPKATPQLPRR